MIVDLHRHLWSVAERYPGIRIPGAVGGSLHSGEAGAPEPIPNLEQRGAELVAEMDQAGVDRSVIFLGDYGLRLGEGTFTVEAENRLTAELARRHPDRLIAFLGVDPRRPGALDLFRHGLEAWGVRGMKMHPATGFRPSDPECRPFFELAGRHGVPIACHTGPMVSPLLSHTCRPIYLDEMAADYPETTIIVQHSGQQAWWREALNIAFWKPNLILELSMWQWAYLQDRREFVAAIARMKDTIGVERIVFASDLPGLRQAMSLRTWVEVFQNLPTLAQQYGYDLTEADARAILGGNAARILGLPT